MKRKNKIGFGFNLAFSVSLIVLGIIFLLYTTYLFNVSLYDSDYLGYALIFLLFVVSFLTTGIIKIVSVLRNKTSEHSNNLMAFNTFLFNATITVAIVSVLIINAVHGTLATFFVSLASPFIITFTIIPIVLLSIAFFKKRNSIIKIVFMIASVFLSLIPIVISIFYFILINLPFVSFILLLFFALELTFGIYLCIELHKQKMELEKVDNSIVEESTNYKLN